MALKRNAAPVNPEGAAVTPGAVGETTAGTHTPPETQHIAPAREPAEPQAATTPEPQAEAQTLPATKTAAPAPTVSAKQLMKHILFSDLEDAFIADFGTLPRLLASNGCVMDGDKKILGAYVVGQVLSWNKRWTITPAAQNAPDNLVKFSMDNQTLDDGSNMPVADYVAELKAQGYPDACSKEYYDVIINLLEAEKGSDLVGGMVQIQMAPQSRKDFDAFRLQTSFRISNGGTDIDAANRVKFSATVISGKTNTWTQFKTSLA